MINRTSEFSGWNEWKSRLLEGIDCEVSIRREGNRIVVVTENLGIAIRCVTTIQDEVSNVFAALTGDQCALTDIRVVAFDYSKKGDAAGDQ